MTKEEDVKLKPAFRGVESSQLSLEAGDDSFSGPSRFLLHGFKQAQAPLPRKVSRFSLLVAHTLVSSRIDRFILDTSLQETSILFTSLTSLVLSKRAFSRDLHRDVFTPDDLFLVSSLRNGPVAYRFHVTVSGRSVRHSG